MLYQQLSYAVIGWINGTVSSSDAAMISHRRIFAIAQSEELDASVHINPRSTRPHGLKNLGASLDHHSGTRDLVGLFASIRTLTTRGNCDWGCRCQCHTRQGVESPGRLTEVFGTLFYSHTGTSLLRKRSCNWSACAQKESASCQLTYHFPRWLIMGAVMFTTSYRTLGGVSVSWSISLPRAISASHKAWQCIENNQPHEFLQLLRARSISGNDIADDDGVSLLIVSYKTSRGLPLCAKV